MRSILVLVNKFFWKGWIGPIFAYLVPLILTIFVGRVISPSLILPGAFMVPTLCVLLIFMPQSIFEFRNSSLLKRIGITPIKPIKFLVAISVFNLIIVVSAFWFLFFCCFAIFHDSLGEAETIPIKIPLPPAPGSQVPSIETLVIRQPTFMSMIKTADWASYIYSQVIFGILCALIGLFIASVARSSLFILSTGIAILLITLFGAPCVLPVSLVGGVPLIKIFGYLVPLKYPIASSIQSFTSGLDKSIVNYLSTNMWDIDKVGGFQVLNVLKREATDPSIITVFSKVDMLLNIIMPYFFIFLFGYLVACTFRWNNRGKAKFRWNIVFETIKNLHIYKKTFKENESRVRFGDPKSKNIITVSNLQKSFKTKNNLKVVSNNISFNIKRGRNLAILGANGAGKTVLTEMILGVEKPDNGYIQYNFDFHKSYKDGLGIQFQDSTYPYGIRCKDIIHFFIKAYKLKITKEEKDELIKQFGIEEFYYKNTTNLSGGQRQRLNLLLSILHKPKIVFLDELSTGLDIKIRTEFKKFIKDYARKNDITIVIISHDMDEVKFLCKDIMVLKDGIIQEKSTVKSIIRQHKSLEKFLYQYL